MSIGSAYQWPQYPTSQAANRLVKQGNPAHSEVWTSPDIVIMRPTTTP